MNESEMRLVGIKDFLSLLVELIEMDLLFQNNFHSNIIEKEAKKILQLKLRKRIFRLIEIKDESTFIAAEEWYFQKIKKSNSINLLQNEKDLIAISTEILLGLDRFRMQALNG